MLAWARVSAKLDASLVEELESLKPGTLAKWESGEGTPTYAKLRKLANRYKRPLHVFYLPEPPAGFTVVSDFRTLPSDAAREFSPELTYAIRLAQERQSWASDQIQEDGYSESALVGSLSIDASVKDAVAAVRAALGVQEGQQVDCESESAAYTFWRRKCEAAGVFVFSASKVSTHEMRGLALADRFAPAIVVNSSDSYGPKCFTLIHELAHVLLGNTSLSGEFVDRIAPTAENATERFCNKVATEVLVPAEDFIRNVPPNWAEHYPEMIRTLRRRYWVTPSVIAIRFFETGFASQQFVRDRLKEAANRPLAKKTGGPIPQFKLAISRVGESFSRYAISAFYSGELAPGELSSLLKMKMSHLPALERAVYSPSTPTTGSEGMS